MLFAHRDLMGVDIMEARNLLTAREMLQSGHWMLPTLFGEPRLAKPPLPTWLTALTMQLLSAGSDTRLAAARIPSALAGLLLALSLFGLTRHWTRSFAAAAWSMAFLATSWMFVLMSRHNTWDIFCHAFMLAAIWCLSVIMDSSRPRRGLGIAAGVLMGLSGLSKGPVGYYALLLPFTVAALVAGDRRKIRTHWRILLLALGLGVLLSVSWSAAAWVAMPQIFSGMITAERGAWLVRHTRPLWFYLQFPLMTGIWAIPACATLWPGHAKHHVETLMSYWRPLVWLLTAVALLMLIPEKKDRYLLPVLPPLCMLLGTYITALLRDPEHGGRTGRTVTALTTGVFALALIVLPVGLTVFHGRLPDLDTTSAIGISLAALLSVLLLYRFFTTGNRFGLYAAEVGLLAAFGLILPVAAHLKPADLSISVDQVRARIASAPVFEDGSLKFQDAWILGTRPLRVGTDASLPDRFWFATRKKTWSSEQLCSDCTATARLSVSELTGHTLYLVALHRNSID